MVYKNRVPANRIVVKMQTHVGDLDLGQIVGPNGSYVADPFFGDANKATPLRWKIQYLNGFNSWVDAVNFSSTDTRADGSAIIGSDGYVEISYGLDVPQQYKNIFVFAGEVLDVASLPTTSVNGYSYLYKTSPKATGTFYIWIDELQAYQSFPAVPSNSGRFTNSFRKFVVLAIPSSPKCQP